MHFSKSQILCINKTYTHLYMRTHTSLQNIFYAYNILFTHNLYNLS